MPGTYLFPDPLHPTASSQHTLLAVGDRAMPSTCRGNIHGRFQAPRNHRMLSAPMTTLKELQDRAASLLRRFEQLKESL